MRTVRDFVNQDNTVVMSLHQPSLEMFELFDVLLLLGAQGNVMYSGPANKAVVR